MIIKLGFTSYILESTGTTMQTLSSVFIIPFRTRTSHFAAAAAAAIPFIFAQFFPRRRSLKVFFRWKTSCGQTWNTRCFWIGSQISIGLCQIGWIVKKILLGRSSAAEFYGFCAASCRYLTYWFSDSDFLKFYGFDTGW